MEKLIPMSVRSFYFCKPYMKEHKYSTENKHSKEYRYSKNRNTSAKLNMPETLRRLRTPAF